jgi:sulfoxide reductase catalytic subunit YedY
MKKILPTPEDNITPKALYLNRREFLRAMGITSAALLLAACEPGESGSIIPSFGQDQLTAKEKALDYVNFYEFSFSKYGNDERAQNFVTNPWEIQIDGLVANPQTLQLQELIERYKID